MSKPKKKSSSAALWVVAGVAVVAVGAMIAFSALGSKKEEPAPQPTAVAGVKTDTEQKAVKNQMGNKEAKVTVVEWGDYL
ncbi:MAG TPA: hypothetical protein VNT75_31900 [Symbiobacteriaceae bacterium]|nr:hypothetical protein [Symbiobacteriaceae bacterium]